MAIRSGFFNSIDGDRKYNAERFAEYFNSFIGNGVFPNPSNGLQVISNDDMTVTAKAGKAWINGYIIVNDDDYILEIEPADGVLNRIDRIVARLDVVDREIRLQVKKGVFASSPIAPSLQRDADAYELGLADVAINKGLINITQANIIDLRLNSEFCGIVKGTVEEIDTTTLFNQYQSWITQKKNEYDTDLISYTDAKHIEINDIITDFENEFNIWLDSIQNILDESTAGNLLSMINENRTQINTLDTDVVAHKADYVTFKNNIEAVKYEDDKLFLKVNGEWIEFKSGGQYPVGNVSGLKVDEDDMQVTINWIDPPDLTINDSLENPITLSKWAGTQLRRKKLSYPSSENDGELVVDSKIRDQYKTNGYIDSGLVNDEEYFYMLFPYTEDGAFTVDSANRISATPTEIDPDTWAGVQKIVRKGLANDYFTVGDQIASNYDGDEIIWEVIGIDIDTPADPSLTHSMTLQTKDCLHDIQFDAPEPSNPDSNRKSYGNNRYTHSAVKQWLNSNETTFIWQSQHQYDAKPTANPELYDGAGFLNRLDPELAGVLGEVNKKVALNTATDGGGQEEIADKVFLLSPKEAGYTPSEMNADGDYTGEFVYPFYDGKGNANRIKNLNYSPWGWWLRSPYVSNPHSVRSVLTSGALHTIDASNSYGLSPACTIV